MKLSDSFLFLALLTFLVLRPGGARAEPGATVPVCARVPVDLPALLSAYDRRSGARQQKARALHMARRARHSAWLPQLLVSAEHRRRSDQSLDRQVATALGLQNKRGEGLVLRAQMRWSLERLVHHHASLSALRFARTLSVQHQASRMELASLYARWKMLFHRACRGDLTQEQYAQSVVLRAQVMAATGLKLPATPIFASAPKATSGRPR